jgi:hypothetical protein
MTTGWPSTSTAEAPPPPLERHLQSLGVHTISGSVAHPQTQGKNERLHSTLRRFLAANQPIRGVRRLRALLAEFDAYYNTERAHQSLEPGQTPAEAYRATPKAPPPTPSPTPDPAPGTPGAAHELREVAANGTFYFEGHAIYIGKHHARTAVHILHTPDLIAVYGDDGAKLAEFLRANLTPGCHLTASPSEYHCGPRA